MVHLLGSEDGVQKAMAQKEFVAINDAINETPSVEDVGEHDYVHLFTYVATMET